MPTLPYAKQTLTSKDKIQRKGTCPEHEKESTKFLYSQDENGKTVWVFKCIYLPNRPHVFNCLPDRSAPKNQEEVNEWVNKQRNDRVLSLDKNKRTRR